MKADRSLAPGLDSAALHRLLSQAWPPPGRCSGAIDADPAPPRRSNPLVAVKINKLANRSNTSRRSICYLAGLQYTCVVALLQARHMSKPNSAAMATIPAGATPCCPGEPRSP
jgi:hypothetical protein